MRRFVIASVIGVVVVSVSAALLWLILPTILSLLTSTNTLLAIFPFLISAPALLIGGYAAARVASSYRLAVGGLVGLVSTTLVLVLLHTAGGFVVIFTILFVGAMISALGAIMAR